VEYRILGPLEVCDDDELVELGPGKERALLAVLLLEANAVVPRERLLDELWGESPPATAAKALNVHVSQLRKRLGGAGDNPIATRPPGYAIELQAEQLDGARFERLVEKARDCIAAGDAATARPVLRDALSLWRGRALSGIQLEGGARTEVARLEELRISAQMDRIDCDLALGLHEQVLGELASLVAAHPLRERLHGQLMLTLYRSGRQAEALDAYRCAREKLVGELGIEPSPALQRLERAILNHDSALEAPSGVLRDRHSSTPVAEVQGRPRLRLGLVGAAVAACAVFALGAFAVFAGFGHSPLSAQPNSLVSLDAAGRLVRATSVGVLPASLAYDGGSVYVLNRQDGTVSRVDTRNGRVVRNVSLRGNPLDVAAGEGALWVLGEVNGHGAVERLDSSGLVRSTTTLTGLAPRAIAAGEGGIWVADESNRGTGGVLLRLSARTGQIIKVLRLPSKPVDVAVGTNSIWVLAKLPPAPGVGATAGAVYVIDPASGRIAARTTVSFVPATGVASIAVGGPDDNAWLATGLGTLDRLDSTTAEITQRIHLPTPTIGAAVSGDSVWTVSRSGIVSRIDAATGHITRQTQSIAKAANATAIVAGAGRVWITLARPAGSSPRPKAVAGAPTSVAIAVRGGPTRVRFGDGSLWIKSLDGSLTRIDAHTHRVVARIAVGSGWGDVGFGFGSVWATSFDDNVVARIDPSSNRVVARIATHGVAPLGVAVTRNAVWVGNHHAGPGGTGSIVRIDPHDDRVVAQIPLGAATFCCGPDNITSANGDVWVDIPNQRLVVRIDARRNRVRARIRVPTGCGQLVAGAGSVWLADGCSTDIIRIDPRRDRIAHVIDTGGADVYPIGFANKSVWATTDDLRLLRIDPTTNSIVDAIDVAPATRPDEQGPWFAAGEGSMWLADYGGNRVLKVSLSR
jgi:YVTN family beta-propeller protein